MKTKLVCLQCWNPDLSLTWGDFQCPKCGFSWGFRYMNHTLFYWIKGFTYENPHGTLFIGKELPL